MIIYTLSSSSDPDNIRYVGKTNDIKDRLRRHIGKHYLNNEITYKNNWIKSELLNGNKILIKQIEIVNEENWQEREKYWIDKFLKDGFKLTNSTEGGEGIILNRNVIEKRIKTRISNTEERLEIFIKKFNIKKVENSWVGERVCPHCEKIIEYKNLKRSYVFNNIRRAEKFNRGCIFCKSKGEKNHFYGKKLNDGKIKRERYGKKILQFDLDGNLVSEYKSIREASEKTGIDRKSISNCARGIKHFYTTHGFKFKIKEI